MGKLIKNLVPYWKTVILVFLLLVMQAYCDLSLPQYTSNIIDTGIINGGVEHILPEKMTEESYIVLSLFSNEDETKILENNYTKDGEIYVRKELTKEELTAYDSEMLIPVTLAYQLNAMMNSDANFEEGAEESMVQGQFDMDQMTNAIKSGQISIDQVKQMAGSYIDEGRKAIENMLETTGEKTVMSMALSYTKDCQKDAGMDADKVQMNYLWIAGGKMVSFALIQGIIAIFATYFSAIVGAKVGRDLRKKVYEKVIGFSNAEIDKFSTASLITRSTNDIQQISMVSVLMLRLVMFAPIMGCGGVIKAMKSGADMGWVIGLAVLMILALVGMLMAFTMPKFKIMQTLVDRVNLVSREILTGLSVIRAFGREEREEERFDVANKDLMKTQLFTSRAMAVMMPGMMIIMNGTSILITWVAAQKIDLGTMQVGAMTAFIQYAMQIVISFLMITMISIMLPRAGVAADRIDEVLKTDSTILEKENAKEKIENKGVVRYENVFFKYPGAKECVLEDINFEAKPGEVTAIIGSTGCGKSTLVNLLPRFYDVTEGKVTIDGEDIRDFTMKSLRDGIGFVPQKGVLFSGTIASNLRFGKHDASEEELALAAEIAQATEFIEEKPEKYNSEISQGGTNVSGGQKQRLSIARAIIKKPKIMVFDDSFSALDMKTDAALRKALSDKIKDSTVIIVAQRISTIIHADQILVLDEGRIVGKGKHEDLLRNCEVYEQIARSQLSAKELGLEEKEA